MDIVQSVTEYLNAGKSAVELLKTAVGFLPRGSKGVQAQAREEIERAEIALKASEAAAAKAFGYQLCQCTFPPQIMLWKEAERASVCPACGHRAYTEYRISDAAVAALDAAGRRR